jgi:hypothetical protein
MLQSIHVVNNPKVLLASCNLFALFLIGEVEPAWSRLSRFSAHLPYVYTYACMFTKSDGFVAQYACHSLQILMGYVYSRTISYN